MRTFTGLGHVVDQHALQNKILKCKECGKLAEAAIDDQERCAFAVAAENPGATMMNVKVNGDAEHGYHVDIHDGEHFHTFHPEGATSEAEAKHQAMVQYAEKIKPQPEPAERGNAVVAELMSTVEHLCDDLAAANQRIDLLEGRVAKFEQGDTVEVKTEETVAPSKAKPRGRRKNAEGETEH
jgi:hypothetical protein